MKELRRSYLDELISTIGTEDIKVITGIRRAGKSFLLRQFEQHISANIPDANIISINLSSTDFEELLEYHALESYITTHYKEGAHNFVLIDEVQMSDGFERAINSLHASRQYDIYLTGSNAFLMSSDLATLFTGRTYTIHVFPFSFKEYLAYHDHPADIEQAFDDYFYDGGFAGSYAYPTRDQRYKYIREVYDTLILRDIIKKHKIKNPYTLNAICDFLTDSISKKTSMRSVAKGLNSAASTPVDESWQDINHVTTGQYVSYLCEAYAFIKMPRYDIRGKQYLASLEKYYLTDHSFRFARLGTKVLDYGRIYENIVAIELLRRGYEVYVGSLWDKEVDFVAKKGDEKLYFQVSSDIASEETFTREVAPLLAINDAYPKILIARTRQPEANYEGIRILNLATFLSEDQPQLPL